jgi:Centromere DNA-binding protein complex CBF3 subunit, domain 2
MRHMDVTSCPVGAYAFYLMYRFSVSMEMSPPPDFTDNESWFDIKVLTDATRRNAKKGITDQVYGRAMKRTLQKIGIESNHYAHIGRVMGPKYLEFQEMSQDEIRIMGNWDPKTQESTYSAKLPMKAIRTMGGFNEGSGMHYNPRTSVEVPETLAKMVFPWLEESMNQITAYETIHKVRKDTARCFLNYMSQLRRVVIQDAAAIYVKHRERWECCLLAELGVFRTIEFKVNYSKYFYLFTAAQTNLVIDAPGFLGQDGSEDCSG